MPASLQLFNPSEFREMISPATLSRLSTILACCMLLAACGSSPTIATDVTYCCRADVEGIDTFRVDFEDTPDFLKPMLRDEASIVLAARGLQYTESNADAVLMMRFVNKTQQRIEERAEVWTEETIIGQNDGWSEPSIEPWERVAPAGGVRFIAQIVLEMKDSSTSELIWSGSMQRIHNVYEGSHMHDAPARTAMRNAFLEMFADFPNPRREID